MAVTAPGRSARKVREIKQRTCLAVAELCKARAVRRVHVDVAPAVQQRNDGAVLAGHGERHRAVHLRL